MKNFFDKGFRVSSLTQPQSGYGLCDVVLVARDGEAWKIRVGIAKAPRLGEDIRIRLVGTRNVRDWSSHGFEFPERLNRMPLQVIRLVYG